MPPGALHFGSSLRPRPRCPYQPEPHLDKTTQVFHIPLTAGLRSPFAPETELGDGAGHGDDGNGDAGGGSKGSKAGRQRGEKPEKDEEAETDEGVTVSIDLDGIVERLQLVFQDPVAALDPQMRVHDLVGEALLVHEPQLTAEERLERVGETLGRAGLDAEYLDRFPHELSGGQAQRVAIARALILRPRVLVCDEAVAALDGSVREQVLALLRQVQADTGLSIIFISHDLAVVQSLSHRVLVMYLGRLFELADNRALFSAPRHPYTRALIDAVPVPDPLVPPRTAPLQGEVPSPLDPPSGCVFHPRCPYATHICAREEPATRDVDGTRVACHRAEELDLKIKGQFT